MCVLPRVDELAAYYSGQIHLQQIQQYLPGQGSCPQGSGLLYLVQSCACSWQVTKIQVLLQHTVIIIKYFFLYNFIIVQYQQ